jgi:hypothetical protein
MTDAVTTQKQQKIKSKKRILSKKNSSQQSDVKPVLPSEAKHLQELGRLWEDAS